MVVLRRMAPAQRDRRECASRRECPVAQRRGPPEPGRRKPRCRIRLPGRSCGCPAARADDSLQASEGFWRARAVRGDAVKFGIGQSVRRVEDQRFVTGRGRYVDDIDLAHQAYGVVVYSSHAHAGIKRVDTSAAKAAPGVLCVLTGADAAAEKLGAITPFLMPEMLGAPKG